MERDNEFLFGRYMVWGSNSTLSTYSREVFKAIDLKEMQLVDIYKINKQECCFVKQQIIDLSNAIKTYKEKNTCLVGLQSLKEYYEEGDYIICIWDYVEGISLHQYIRYISERNDKKRCGFQGGLTLQEAFEKLLPICQSLQILHESGIIYGDIIPSRDFVVQGDEVRLRGLGGNIYKIAAFDMLICDVTEYCQSERNVDLLGRNDQIGPWTDVFSMAVVMCECILGKTYDIRELERGMRNVDYISYLKKQLTLVKKKFIPEKYKNVLLKGMEEQPGQRYQTIQEFVDALYNVIYK